MSVEPAGEKLVKNLQQAVERLQDDIQRVEVWTGALGGFSKPIPDYGHGQTKHDLPPLGQHTPQKGTQHRDTRQENTPQEGAPQGAGADCANPISPAGKSPLD